MLDIDGDQDVEALTDGLFVLRWLFGFRDEALIAGLLDAGCTRCTADEIEDYLGSIEDQLDIDGDGDATPLNDGLLVLRFLFDFTGTLLTNGAVNLDECTRCDAEAIELYLEGLL